MAALSHLSPEALHRAVVQGDVARLTQISGVGKKTAERIVVDLAEPLSKLDIASGGPAPVSRPSAGDAALKRLEDGLRYLGYANREIHRVAREVDTSGSDGPVDVETLIKRALKLLQ